MAKQIFQSEPELLKDSASAHRRRACLLVNPVGGGVAKDHGEQVAQIWTQLRAAGIWAEIVETRENEPPGILAAKAVEEGFSMVIACGGDGTVGAVAKGLIGTNCPLGILPMGTYNNFARSLRLPLDVKSACKILARGRIRHVDVGLANDEHYFLEAAGVGIDAELFPLGEEIKSGNWRRLWEAAKLAYRAAPARIHFELDLPLAEAYQTARRVSSQAHHPFASGSANALDFSAFMLIVANTRYYGSGFTVSPDAILDDGLFNIRIFRNFSKGELLKHFWSISRRRYAYSPKIDTFSASEINITAKSAVPFHVDGYQVGHLPLKLRSLRRALKVIA